jgi:hypothetical protein
VLSAFAIGCSPEHNVTDPVAQETRTATMTPQPSVTDSIVQDMPAGTVATGTAPQSPEVTVSPLSQSSSACPSTLTTISPDGALLDTIDRMMRSYPIGGVWGRPTDLDFTPKEAPLEGELVVSRRDGDVSRIEGCGSGIEVPVAVMLRTKDGGLAESVEGTARLTHEVGTTIDGTPTPFRAELSAFVDLDDLSGNFSFADDPTWTFGKAALRAELTPFGTRGMMGANIEAKDPPEPGSATRAPWEEPLLTWNGGNGCVGNPDADPEPALFPAPTEMRTALDAALAMTTGKTYRAKYADGAETKVSVEFTPLTLLCATNFWASYWHFPTSAHLRTNDGRVDVTIGVAIDPGYSQLHYNNLTEVPWAYPPSGVEKQIGHIDVPLSGYSHVGLESWFDLEPQPAGWLKVLGYPDGACTRCNDIGGCIDCAFTERVEILSLFIGTEADQP